MLFTIFSSSVWKPVTSEHHCLGAVQEHKKPATLTQGFCILLQNLVLIFTHLLHVCVFTSLCTEKRRMIQLY